MASLLDKMEDLARIFQVIGDKTRLSIMTLLAECEMNVTGLCDKLDLAQSTVSGHLSHLYTEGLVGRRRVKKEVFYSLANLSKHRLGRKPELAKPGTNAAKFGPVELIFPTK